MSSRQDKGSRQPLAGSTIVVTRPLHQAGSLSRRIEELGGSTIVFPALAIVARVSEAALSIARRLGEFDLAVFVSANAVWHGVPLVRRYRAWPEQLTVAVVGPGTAAAIRGQALSVDIEPEVVSGADGLLTRAELQTTRIRGSRIAIFRGHGGLSTLGDELAARGAQVEYAEVYQRQKPELDAGALNERGSRGEIDIIIVTSGDGLRNLFVMLGESGQQWLRRTRFLVVSERVAELGTTYDLQKSPIVACGSSDEQIVAALLQWCEQKGCKK